MSSVKLKRNVARRRSAMRNPDRNVSNIDYCSSREFIALHQGSVLSPFMFATPCELQLIFKSLPLQVIPFFKRCACWALPTTQW